VKAVASIYKVKVGKQGRIVLPKELREVYEVNTGDEAIIIAKGQELSIHLHKVSKDPVEHLTETSRKIFIGLSAEKLKQTADEERIRQHHST
jgi:AbrB family looped-hinge helix DNA binding protein